MPHGFESVKDLASTVAGQGRPEDIHVGQVICLGMDELKVKLGEARWEKTQALIRKIMEETLDKILGQNDSFMRSRDGSYVVVFGDAQADVAEAKAARISELANSLLFGEDEVSGITVQPISVAHGGMTVGSERSPEDVLNSLLEKARQRSLLHAAEDASSGDAVGLIKAMEESVEATESTGTTKNIETGVEPPSNRKAKDRAALIEEFKAQEDPEISFGYASFWDSENNRVALFQCFPMRVNPIGGPMLRGYDVLGANAEPAAIVDLDLATLEIGLLAHSTQLRSGNPQILVFPVQYETLCDPRGHRELVKTLKMAPSHVQKTIVMQLSGVPEGTRLADLIAPLQPYMNTLMVSVSASQAGAKSPGYLRQFRSVGVSIAVVNLPSKSQPADEAAAVKFLMSAEKLGMNTGISGIASPHLVKAFATMKVQFFAGPLFGGPFYRLPRAHRLKTEQFEQPGNLALAEAKSKSLDIADWSNIADKYGITFGVTKLDKSGVACFTYLSSGVSELSGFEPSELEGQPVSTLQARDMDKLAASAFFGRLNQAGEGTVRLKNVRKDGALFGVRIRAFRLPAGGSNGASGETFYAFYEKCNWKNIPARPSSTPQAIEGQRVAAPYDASVSPPA